MIPRLTLYYFSFRSSIEPALLIAARKILNAEEKARSERITSKDALRSFLLGRLIVKTEISKITGLQPEQVSILLSKNGKPFIQGKKNEEKIFISLSHCQSGIIVAIANHNLGVDLEPPERGLGLIKKADKFLPDLLVQRLRKLEESEQALRFIQLWTAMEARVKLTDGSIFSERKNFPLSLEANNQYIGNDENFAISWLLPGEGIFSVFIEKPKLPIAQAKLSIDMYNWQLDRSQELDTAILLAKSNDMSI